MKRKREKEMETREGGEVYIDIGWAVKSRNNSAVWIGRSASSYTQCSVGRKCKMNLG
jgi:hypothetical protein